GKHAPETAAELSVELEKPKDARDYGRIGELTGQFGTEIGFSGLAGLGVVRPGAVRIPGEKVEPVPSVLGGFVPTAKQPGLQNMVENLRNIVQVASGEEPSGITTTA